MFFLLTNKNVIQTESCIRILIMLCHKYDNKNNKINEITCAKIPFVELPLGLEFPLNLSDPFIIFIFDFAVSIEASSSKL